MYSVNWPLNASKAESDLALIQTSLLFSFDLHNKSGEVFIKTRSPSASLPSKGQVTEQTTVKCYIDQAWVQDGWVTVLFVHVLMN